MRDRDINYPVKHFVNKYFIENGITTIRKIEVGNRFLKGNVPSDEVYEKLFNSITFKENVDDCATTTKAGLVKIATDNQLTAGTEKDEQGFVLIPTAKQIANKPTSVVPGPTISGYFPDSNNTVWNMISTKIINKQVYIKIVISFPANTKANNTVQLNFTNFNINHFPANTIMSDKYIITIQALQNNKTCNISIALLNKLATSLTTTITYQSPWLILI